MKGNINTRFYGTNFFEQKTDPSDFFTANSQLNYLVQLKKKKKKQEKVGQTKLFNWSSPTPTQGAN